MDIEVALGDVETRLASLRLQLDLQSRIKVAQLDSLGRDELLRTIRNGNKTAIRVDDKGMIRYDERLWV